MKTVRRLEGVAYWVLSDPGEIRSFINTNVKAEWEQDDREDGDDAKKDEWLLGLRRRTWGLKKLAAEDIRLERATVSRRGFLSRLDERSEEMRRAISVYHMVIWPVVVAGEDLELKDGYCRLATLKKLGVRKVLAYVGTLR